MCTSYVASRQLRSQITNCCPSEGLRARSPSRPLCVKGKVKGKVKAGSKLIKARVIAKVKGKDQSRVKAKVKGKVKAGSKGQG